MKEPKIRAWRQTIIILTLLARFLSLPVFFYIEIRYEIVAKDKEDLTFENRPFIIFIASALLNWRLLISFILFFLYLLAGFICCCYRISKVSPNESYLKPESRLEFCSLRLLISWLRRIFLGHFDLPCCKHNRGTLYLIQLIKNVIAFTAVGTVGVIQMSYLKNDDYPELAIQLYFAIFPSIYVINLAIIMRRLIQTRHVPKDLRDVFSCDEHFSHKLTKIYIFSDSKYLSAETTCSRGEDCASLDIDHRIMQHGATSCQKFKPRKVKKNTSDVNVVIGVHQTSIENVKKILATHMIRGSSNEVCQGIHFSTNVSATMYKSKVAGAAFIVAKIDLGKTHVLTSGVIPDFSWKNAFNSIYYLDDSGLSPANDEFVLPNDKPIVEYAIVVTEEAVEDYRRKINSCGFLIDA